MLKLLQAKGYNGSDSIEEILEWLFNKNIYIDLISTYDENGLNGYYAQCRVPPYQAIKTTGIYKTKKDALELLIYDLKEYIKC